MHHEIEPAIHYWGTPVVLISTRNEDGTPNLSPMSSAWWLGWSAMIGLDASSKTTANLLRTGECVLNLASVKNIEAVNHLAKTTGSEDLPRHKRFLGYRHVHDKFQTAGLTQLAATVVSPPRVLECSVHLEARLANSAPFGEGNPRMVVPTRAFELSIVAAHADSAITKSDNSNHIDPDKWQPLIMNFRRLYGISAEVASSVLAEGPEDAYAPWKFEQSTGTTS